MSGTRQMTEPWELRRAMLLGVVCLAVGMAGGWLIRGWDLAQAGTPARAVANAQSAQSTPAASDPTQLKAQADAQAAPLLEQLKAKPEDGRSAVTMCAVWPCHRFNLLWTSHTPFSPHRCLS